MAWKTLSPPPEFANSLIDLCSSINFPVTLPSSPPKGSSCSSTSTPRKLGSQSLSCHHHYRYCCHHHSLDAGPPCSSWPQFSASSSEFAKGDHCHRIFDTQFFFSFAIRVPVTMEEVGVVVKLASLVHRWRQWMSVAKKKGIHNSKKGREYRERGNLVKENRGGEQNNFKKILLHHSVSPSSSLYLHSHPPWATLKPMITTTLPLFNAT